MPARPDDRSTRGTRRRTAQPGRLAELFRRNGAEIAGMSPGYPISLLVAPQLRGNQQRDRAPPALRDQQGEPLLVAKGVRDQLGDWSGHHP
jgi:hypothetical protein